MSLPKKIPTPLQPSSVFAADFEDVYEPAEDSFLLLDALEQDLEFLQNNTSICLECGSGSGLIITALSSCLNPQSQDPNDPERTICNPRSLMIATDINPLACRTTTKCAKFNGQPDVMVIQTNLADGLVTRFENKVDLLVFNPPYVPSTTDEIGKTNINLAWAGGQDGRQITTHFLNLYVPRLLSKPNGRLYLVVLDKNNVSYLKDLLLKSFGITGEIILDRQCGIEHLYVVRYVWNAFACR